MSTMLIGGLQKLTLIDYPGKIACTVFCAGCSFRCPWCYNAGLVLPEKIKVQPRISEKEFFAFLKKKKGLLEGCVLGGGEPTINPELVNFCKKIKAMDYLIKLDTNGSNPEMIKKLIAQKLVDYVALDIKAPKEKYLKVIGLENQVGALGVKSNFWEKKIIANIEESIKILKQSEIDSEFRTTVVPTLINKSDILEIAKWIGPAKKYYLQEFRANGTVSLEFAKKRPYPRKYLIEVQKTISPFFEVCQIRG